MFKVRAGTRVDGLCGKERIEKLAETLSLLENRQRLCEIAFYSHLSLQIGNAEHDVKAYIKDRHLMLVGRPLTFAAEAAGQLIEYFRLGQRASVVPFLTVAISYL